MNPNKQKFSQGSSSSKAVVILGGGFAGLTTALALSQSKPKPQIILVEQRSRFIFQPLLYELLSEELQAWEITPDYYSLLGKHGIAFVKDVVVNIDTINN